MENEKNRVYTIVALVAVATLMLSCIVGALAGGLAGFVVGRRQARAVSERAFERDLGAVPRFREQMPWQECEEHPMHPPGFEEDVPPYEMMPPGIEGALVVGVIEDTPADRAGLAEGDIITAVDRMPIDVAHPLPDVIGSYEPGDRATIFFWRGDREDSMLVKFDGHPDNPRQAYLGVYYEMLEWPHFDGP